MSQYLLLMQKYLALIPFFVIILFSDSMLPSASAHGIVDQSHTGPFTHERPLNELPFQTFTPSTNNLIGVDIYFSDNDTPIGNSELVTVTIRSGVSNSGASPWTASKIVTSTGATISNPRIEHFDFIFPVPLVPGNTYTISATSSVVGNIAWVVTSPGDPYPGGFGSLGANTVPNPNDRGFATYFDFSLPVDPYEPNNAANIAFPLDVPSCGSVSVSAANLVRNDEDWYRFFMESSPALISTSNNDFPIQLLFVDSNNNFLVIGEDMIQTPELPPGEYFVGVIPSFPSPDFQYQLTIDLSQAFVCLPTSGGDSQVIGGEIIPIETTSLLLAGTQSFSWMIPVVLSGIGIGLFVVSRKSDR